MITENEIIEILNKMVATTKYKPQSADDVIRTGAFISARYSMEDITKALMKKIKEGEKTMQPSDEDTIWDTTGEGK